VRNVVAFAGNTTDKLWAMMGDVVNAQGIERHGQSCFLYVHPNGTPETRALIAEKEESATLVEDETPHGPIDQVAQIVLENFVQCRNFDSQDSAAVLEYDGYRVGAGWIYGAILVAKSHGATQADVQISSNDGNLYMEAWDTTLGVLVTALHITYYGT
jgi:hypothetical protein